MCLFVCVCVSVIRSVVPLQFGRDNPCMRDRLTSGEPHVRVHWHTDIDCVCMFSHTYIAKYRKEELELENSRKYSKPRKEKLRKRNSSGKIERPRMAPKLRADLDT